MNRVEFPKRFSNHDSEEKEWNGFQWLSGITMNHSGDGTYSNGTSNLIWVKDLPAAYATEHRSIRKNLAVEGLPFGFSL